MKNIPFILFFLAVLPCKLLSQDEVLLTIDNQPVLKSEFERIYHKNSNIEGYENKPPAEYLEMFINFKLKVLEAKKLGYDTVSSFKTELAGYREQLSRPYLQDRQQIDKLVQEAYKRTINEVNASHIMVKLPATPTPADTAEAYNKAVVIRNRILAGESFEKIAREESDDPSGRINDGLLGWFGAFTMVYPFENAAFNTAAGSYSMPVRSRYGYHIIKVNDFRPALGEIKLAHIMVRAGSEDDPQSIAAQKLKIENCYKSLQDGSSFSEMVPQYSEDAGTARSNGQMRWLRSGELPSDIEKAVFALSDSGDYTRPVQSDYGWHIFQLQGKRPIAPFENMKSQLEERVMMDERGKRTEESFVRSLKKEYGYTAYPENIAMIADILDSSVYSGNWNAAMSENYIEPVFSFGNLDFSQKDLINFIVKTKRYNKKENYQTIVNRKLDELVFNELLNLEKKKLDEKYPSFRFLMEEYHDGILLFNIMDSEVWSKAVSDSAGLKAYYDNNVDNYMWNERADVSVYTVNDPVLAKLVTKEAKKRAKTGLPAAEFVKLICSTDTVPCVQVDDQKYEKEDNLPLGGFTWKKGFSKTVNEGGKVKILMVNAILPPARKAFQETQGQVTADYQNYLDKLWTDTLRSKYSVTVNADVLQTVK